MRLTFKDIVTGLENFVNDHKQINESGFGDLSNMTTKDHTFPMVWLYPTPSLVNGQQTIFRFDVYVMDILEQDRSNLIDVMSETALLGNDMIANFWEDNDNLEFALNETAVTMSPFEMRFDDLTAGWVYTIEIETITNLNSCNIPK